MCYVDTVVPLECPTNVSVNESSLSSTGVELTWNAVRDDPDTLQGFFTGYRVHSVSAYAFSDSLCYNVLSTVKLPACYICP